jgi:L-ascorbate metabolism protein UlaG (beta-lactamase superfamily)
MRLQLVRHATLVVRYPSTCLLIDPQLDEAGTRAPLPGAADAHVRNPTQALPLPAADIAQAADAVMVTHLHADHFDGAARRALDPQTPIICQPEDAETLHRWGFEDVRPVRAAVTVGDVEVQRTPGRHGHGVVAQAMGPVSGFVLRCDGQPTLYVAGDTVWCPDVHETVEASRPEIIVLNGGATRLVEGPPVTMTADDILAVARSAARATIVVAHLEASNACTESRADVRNRLAQQPDVLTRVQIPEDGEELEFPYSGQTVVRGRRPAPT